MKIKFIVLSFIVGIQHLVFSQIQKFPDAKPIYKPELPGFSMVETRNINHPKGVHHQDVKRGTLILLVPKNGNQSGCTATLMNTVPNLASQDYYILTAEHCLENHETSEPFYFSFNYELASATKKYAEDVPIPRFEPFKGGVEKVFVDRGSDTALIKVNSNDLSESEKMLLKHAYAVGYNLHPTYEKEKYSLVSHPKRDHKKIFTNPAKFIPFKSFVMYTNDLFPRGSGFKTIAFENNWDNTNSGLEKGSSGSGLLYRDRDDEFKRDRDDEFKVVGILTSARDKYFNLSPVSYINLLENAWATATGGVQQFLDPHHSWISKIPGGYFNDAIPNPIDIDYDLFFDNKGHFKADLKLNILDYFLPQRFGRKKEDYLGNGLLSNDIQEEIYMTITLKDDPDFLLYGIYHDQSSPDLHTFEGTSWQVKNPPSTLAPKGSSEHYDGLNYLYGLFGHSASSKDMRTHVQNYVTKVMLQKSLRLNQVQIFSRFPEGTLDAKIALHTLDGSESASEVRAIKFPHSMPYNAVELFEPSKFAGLWTFKRYPDSRGKDSNSLFIDQIKLERTRTISTGDNGGYLNMVNELIPIFKIDYLSYIPNRYLNPLTIYVEKESSIKEVYYKIWVDWFPNKDTNNQYNFNDPIDLIAEGKSIENQIKIPEYRVPDANQLGLVVGDARYYRLRIAISDEDNISPNGFYENGEVEDYLLELKVHSIPSSKSTPANGSPKVDQDRLPNAAVLETAPLGDVEAEAALKEAIVVVVLPNPASEVVNILFDSQSAGAVTIGLYTLAGVELINKEIVATAGSNMHKLNTSKLVKGTYIIKVSGTGVDSSTLLAIERN